MQLAPRRDLVQDIGYQFGGSWGAGSPVDVDEPYDGLDLLAGRPKWQADAACKEHDPKLWWPEKSGGSQADAAKARAVCDRCLVKDECRAWALEQGSRLVGGIFGGLNELERRKARRAAA